jgi:hypothetical protein
VVSVSKSRHGAPGRVLHAIGDRLLVHIQSEVIHSLRGASEVVLWISLIAESSLSQHLALLLDLAFKEIAQNKQKQ